MLIVGSLHTGTTAVRHGLVFEGLISARCSVEATGISASATDELNGPTTPMTVASEASAVMFAAPCAGSCPFFRTVESSLLTYFSVQPPMSLAGDSLVDGELGRELRERAVSGITAGQWQVGGDRDRSFASGDSALRRRLTRSGVDDVPQAAKTPSAAIVPIDNNPLVGLTMCWVLLSVRGNCW